ncbi:hypothetical protein Tco_0019672 [Tanacetum coccineum]
MLKEQIVYPLLPFLQNWKEWVLRLLLGTNLVELWPQLSSVLPQTKNLTFPMFLDKQVEGMTKYKEIYVTPSHTKKVFANMKRKGKGFSRRVTPLFQTMMVQAPEELDTEVPQPSGSTEPITNEAANKEHEDASKQGRKIANLDADAEVTLIDEAQGRNDDNLMFDTGVLYEQEVEVEKVVSIAEVTTVSATTTTVDELTLAHTLIEIKTTKPKAITTAATITTTAITKPKARGVVVQEPSEFTKTTSSSQTSQLPQAKDKGKAKMIEPGKPLKKKYQILIDEEISQRLQEELQAELEEEKRLWKEVKVRQKELMEIVPDDEVAIDAIPLTTKSPIIVDWKIIKEEKMEYFQIIRADGISRRPEEAYERVLWGDLKVMFEPDVESKVWRNLQGLGEYSFGSTCKESATILLTYAEYFKTHTKQSSIHCFPLEVDMLLLSDHMVKVNRYTKLKMKKNPNLFHNLALLLIEERCKIKSLSTLYPTRKVSEVQHLLKLSTSTSACDIEYYNVTPLSDSYLGLQLITLTAGN